MSFLFTKEDVMMRDLFTAFAENEVKPLEESTVVKAVHTYSMPTQ